MVAARGADRGGVSGGGDWEGCRAGEGCGAGLRRKAGKGSADSTEHPESFWAFHYEHEQVDRAAAKGRASVGPGGGFSSLGVSSSTFVIC